MTYLKNSKIQEWAMSNHHKIDYVEFPAKDMYKTKIFFAKAFAWKFEDYGPEYCAFSSSGLNGGFFKSDRTSSTEQGSVLVVLYSENLEATLETVEQCGGTIVKSIFEFPGGRRFHFADPNGNEFAVWSDKGGS
jgi:uncharacterized protein